MTLPTGSEPSFQGMAPACSRSRRRGITFLEVMLTAVILAVGLTALYRSFFASLDHLDHLSTRLYAHDLMESRIALIERDFRKLGEFDIGALSHDAQINGRPVHFTYTVNLKPVGSLLTVFELDIGLSWQERGHPVSISRTAYFSGVSPSAGPAGKGG